MSAVVAATITVFPATARAQTPTPTKAQAQAAMSDPAIRARLLAQVRASGMSPDQIRTKLIHMERDWIRLSGNTPS